MHAGVIKFEPKTTEINIHQKLQINGREFSLNIFLFAKYNK